MRHCQAGYGAQRCLSLHLCRGGRMTTSGCTFAGPMPVVLVEAAHQLNPSQTLAICQWCSCLPCDESQSPERGTRPLGTGRFGSLEAAARAAGRRQYLDTGVRQEYAGVISWPYFLKIHCIRVDGHSGTATLVGRFGSATPVARHACCDNCTFLNHPIRPTSGRSTSQISNAKEVRNPFPVHLLPLSFCTSV
jgi:hypothetical protein